MNQVTLCSPPSQEILKNFCCFTSNWEPFVTVKQNLGICAFTLTKHYLKCRSVPYRFSSAFFMVLLPFWGMWMPKKGTEPTLCCTFVSHLFNFLLSCSESCHLYSLPFHFVYGTQKLVSLACKIYVINQGGNAIFQSLCVCVCVWENKKEMSK